jgi:membrane-bound ClpP family serine protease
MIKTIILTLVIGVVLVELIEHVVFPLFWSIMGGKRKSVCGVSGMLGKVGEVKQWKKNEGKVFVNGELFVVERRGRHDEEDVLDLVGANNVNNSGPRVLCC